MSQDQIYGVRALKKLIFLALSLFLHGAAVAGTLAVDGTGTVSVAPDQARVVLSLEARDAQAAPAMARVRAQAIEVIAAMKAFVASPSDVKTENLSVYPQYDHRADGGPSLIDYRAATTVSVMVSDIDKLGAVLDRILALDVGTLDTVQFLVADPTPVESQARILAVQDAMRKADELAKAAGITLGSIQNLSEGGRMTAPVPIMRAAMAEAAGVAAGGIDISVGVSIVYDIK